MKIWINKKKNVIIKILCFDKNKLKIKKKVMAVENYSYKIVYEAGQGEIVEKKSPQVA